MLRGSLVRLRWIGARYLVNKAEKIEVTFENWDKLSRYDKQELLMTASGFHFKAPSNIWLEVVSSGCEGSPCLALRTSLAQTYLFNAPEGVDRLLHFTDNNSRLSQVQHVFATRSSWEANGGLASFILSLSSANAKELTIHGPPFMTRLFDVVRPFFDEGGLKLKVSERDYTHLTFEDTTLSIDYIPIWRNPRLPGLPLHADIREELANQEIRGSLRQHLENIEGLEQVTLDLSVAYLVRFIPRPGRMNLQKCMAAEIPRGPLLGKLQQGEAVTLDNGKIVKSEDVMEPPGKYQNILVVDCPSQDFVASLIEQEKLKSFFDSNGLDDKTHLDVVCHFTPAKVLHSQEYQKWMKGFGSKTRHLLCGDSVQKLPHLPFNSKLQHQLGLISTSLHPPLSNSDWRKDDLQRLPSKEELGGNVFAEPQLCVSLRPDTGLCTRASMLKESAGPDVDEKEAKAEIMSIPDFPNVLQIYKKSVSKLEKVKEIFPRVTFLGTSSSVAGKYRNKAGIWVEVTEEKGIIMDCGEGTTAQLIRLLGDDGAAKALVNLRAIIISHTHLDHHGGLITLITRRAAAYRDLGIPYQNLDVFCVAPLGALLKLCSIAVDNVIDLINLRRLHHLKKHEKDILAPLGLRGLDFVRVNHPGMAHGIILQTMGVGGSPGKKIVYSGDCRPDERLVESGKGADLLIHEATFDTSCQADAETKRHSTTSEAIAVGIRMGAHATILTHFSTRYPKIPILTEEFVDGVGVAWDFMRVSVNEAPLLHLSNPVLKAMYKDAHEVAEAEAERRKIRAEIRDSGNLYLTQKLSRTVGDIDRKRTRENAMGESSKSSPPSSPNTSPKSLANKSSVKPYKVPKRLPVDLSEPKSPVKLSSDSS